MKNRYFKYGFLYIAALFLGLTSCVDQEVMVAEDISDAFDKETEGQSRIDLVVTLDKMSGASFMGTNPMEDIENYIDPEKFRVLFFDENDKFLFESQSRWIRKLPSSLNEDFITWKVSVPFFSYGNDLDEKYDWNWSEIKKSLIKGKKFKIAILANRPGTDYFPDLEDAVAGAAWFDNSGPHWTKENSVATVGVDPLKVKDILSLHHGQWDPIYESKGATGHSQSNYYNFIAGEVNGQLAMGSTASWVKWDKDGIAHPTENNPYDATKKRKLTRSEGGNMDDYRWEYRLTRLPSYEYPIPMYGLQEYDPIPEGDWEDGTTFDLEKAKLGDAVSLLRSVVRLDLLIPESYDVDYVLLFYPNIYSRCEPMNVWDPTDKIWEEDHDKDCEWRRIRAHGPTSKIGDPSSGNSSSDNGEQVACHRVYHERMAWYYGAWRSQGWPFPDWKGSSDIDTHLASEKQKYGEFPQVYNSCIQRNTANFVDPDNLFHDVPGYHHYIVYTGERNVMDPSYLYNMGSTASGNSVVVYWSVGINRTKDALTGEKTKGDRYSFLITDDYSSPQKTIFHTSYDYNTSINPNFPKGVPNDRSNTKPGNNMGGTNGSSGIMYHIANSDKESGVVMPLPLMRNHVYRITMGGTKIGATRSSEDDPGITLKSEVIYNKSINKNKRRR